MPRLVIIRGLPGTGKSTLAREYSTGGFLHYEPDHFFCDTQGRYRFDAQIWDMACKWCVTMTDFALARGEDVVVSDVFPRLAELRPYRALAAAHGATLDVVTLTEQHGNTHKVPLTVRQRMEREFEAGPN